MARFLTTTLVVTLVVGATAHAGVQEPEVGKPAPDFSLVGTDGKTHKLSDYRGKAVVIAWYPKALTGGCTKECSSMRDSKALLEKFPNLVYFAASCDTLALNTEFSDKLDLNFPLLCDTSKEVGKAYGVITPERQVPFRKTFYIDEKGVLRHIDEKVSVSTHGQDIAKRLQKLGIGS